MNKDDRKLEKLAAFKRVKRTKSQSIDMRKLHSFLLYFWTYCGSLKSQRIEPKLAEPKVRSILCFHDTKLTCSGGNILYKQIHQDIS